MDFHKVMERLESMGTAQNRKVYKRHGAGDNQFGVSFANLKELKKEIGKNHQLAVQLWNTSNTDAQTLATMIAEPKNMTPNLAEKWVRETSYYMVVDSLVGNVIFNTPFKQTKMEDWIESDDEWVGRAGWMLMAKIAMQENELPDSYFEGYVKIIENKIHEAKNRTREAMNNGLIAMGIRNSHLRMLASDAARRIGVVDVDHGDTSCKTLDAESYIQKTWARKKITN